MSKFIPTLKGYGFLSKESVRNGTVTIDGKTQPLDEQGTKEIIISVVGDVKNLDIDHCNKLSVNGTVTNLENNTGDVYIGGNVEDLENNCGAITIAGNVTNLKNSCGRITYKQ